MRDRHRVEPKLAKWTVLSFVIGTLFGSGSIWQWKQAKLAAQKQELDRVVETTGLRQKENELYATIIGLTNEYVSYKDQYSNNPSPQLNNEIVQLKSQLDVMKDAFLVLEDNLARLEGRQPRKISIDFIPPAPPTGLTAVVH